MALMLSHGKCWVVLLLPLQGQACSAVLEVLHARAHLPAHHKFSCDRHRKRNCLAFLSCLWHRSFGITCLSSWSVLSSSCLPYTITHCLPCQIPGCSFSEKNNFLRTFNTHGLYYWYIWYLEYLIQGFNDDISILSHLQGSDCSSCC